MATNYGTYAPLLQNAYSQLGREGDEAGINQWTNQINQWAQSGMSGDQINSTVMGAFQNSPEAQAWRQSQQGATGAAPAGQTLDTIGRPQINPTATKSAVPSPSNQIAFGSTLDASRRSGDGGYHNVMRERGDSGPQQEIEYKPWEWNTEGLDFGAAPDPTAKPMINNETGKFEGWSSNYGAWTNQAGYDAMDFGWRGRSGATVGPDGKPIGGDESLYQQLRRPVLAKNGEWVMFDPSAREAPEAFQHGPNNLMQRIASYSPYIIGAMALGGAGMAAAGAGGAAAGGAGTGMTAAEGAALSAEAAGGMTGIGAGGATAAEVAAADAALYGTGAAGAAEAGAAAANPYAIGAEELGAGMATPGSVAPVAGEGGAATAGIAGSNASNVSTLAQVQDYVKKGMSVMEAIQKVMGGSGGAAGNREGQFTRQGGGAGILDLLGAYYSSQQNKDYAGNLKDMYTSQQAKQAVPLAMLQNSYANPDLFYGSNQWKGLESVYQNSIDRGAAKGGTLANPTDRERLLQAYGMKELESWRKGLRDEAGILDPSKLAPSYAEGLKAEAYANTPWFATASKGGAGGGSVGDIWNTVKDVGSTASDIWDVISQWFTTETP